MTTTTKNPNDPRRFISEPLESERRLEELFSRSQKVAGLPATVTAVQGTVTAVQGTATALNTRVVALEAVPARVPDVVNATYTKFDNGLLICTGEINAIPNAGLTAIINDTLTFPVAFVGLPKVSVAILQGSTGYVSDVTVVDIVSITLTTVQARGRTYVGGGTPWSLTRFNCQVVAVGLWK